MYCCVYNNNDVYFSCSVSHPVPSSLHKPITAAEYYVRRKMNKKVAKAAGKVFEWFVGVCVRLCVCVCVCLVYINVVMHWQYKTWLKLILSRALNRIVIVVVF